jgi:hypothetical protein
MIKNFDTRLLDIEEPVTPASVRFTATTELRMSDPTFDAVQAEEAGELAAAHLIAHGFQQNDTLAITDGLVMGHPVLGQRPDLGDAFANAAEAIVAIIFSDLGAQA